MFQVYGVLIKRNLLHEVKVYLLMIVLVNKSHPWGKTTLFTGLFSTFPVE